MPELVHITECEKLIESLSGKTYFPSVLPVYEEFFEEIKGEQISLGLNEEDSHKAATKMVLSRLHDIMRASQPIVEQVIADRLNSGEIRSADQARKNAAGNVFQQLLAYSIARNIIVGNISKSVAVTMSVKGIIDKYAAIKVDEDTLKPDSDVVVYSVEESNSPIMNFSCKTSCRERAGQTYKWKLMCDLATCNCEHKEGNNNCPVTKYNLTYAPSCKILTCFVTTDFYDELNNPQISAMFNFFDYSYVAKTISPVGSSVRILENVVDDINEVF